MSCERFHDALSDHAAGGALTGEAAEHLSACAACSARLERQRHWLEDVDAELERVLSIEASPELVHRVITKSPIASATAWRFPAAWAGLAAAAALAVGIFLRLPVGGPSEGPRQPRAVPTQARVATGPSFRPAVAVPPGSSNATRNRNRHRTVAAKASPSPQTDAPPVLVRPDQAIAIARLYELLRQGRLTEEMLPPPKPEVAAELSVEPLRIPEITVPDVEHVGRATGSALERD